MEKCLYCKCDLSKSGGRFNLSEVLVGKSVNFSICTKCGISEGVVMSGKNKTAQASMLCQSAGFQVWLNADIKFKTGVRVTCEEQAREAVRAWCEVDSLSQLNQEKEPVQRFDRLVALYEYEVM